MADVQDLPGLPDALAHGLLHENRRAVGQLAQDGGGLGGRHGDVEHRVLLHAQGD